MLVIHTHAGLRGIQSTQSTHCGIHQVVAQRQVVECNRIIGCLIGSLIVNAVILSIRQGQLGKVSGLSTRDPGHIALVVHFYIVILDSIAVDECTPSIRRSLIGICFLSFSCIVALQLQNAVDGISLPIHCIVNGNRTRSLLCLRGKSRHGQAQAEDQSHKQCQDACHVFHKIFSPVLFFVV